MSERNDKSEQEIGEEQDIKRWTAKRRSLGENCTVERYPSA
jgi:hypothetical protein